MLLLGDGRRCTTLALSEQWQERGRFTGVLLPASVAEPVAGRLREAAAEVAEAHGLIGLASADFLLDEGGGFHLLEINPRPGASLEAAELFLGVAVGRAARRGLPGRAAAVPATACDRGRRHGDRLGATRRRRARKVRLAGLGG